MLDRTKMEYLIPACSAINWYHPACSESGLDFDIDERRCAAFISVITKNGLVNTFIKSELTEEFRKPLYDLAISIYDIMCSNLEDDDVDKDKTQYYCDILEKFIIESCIYSCAEIYLEADDEPLDEYDEIVLSEVNALVELIYPKDEESFKDKVYKDIEILINKNR